MRRSVGWIMDNRSPPVIIVSMLIWEFVRMSCISPCGSNDDLEEGEIEEWYTVGVSGSNRHEHS